jgi:phosphoglycerate kinase
VRQFKKIEDLGDVEGKKILLRVDLNVPMSLGDITDNTRIRAIIPSVKVLLEKGAKVILLSHFGRPQGVVNPQMSLAPIVSTLKRVFETPVLFLDNFIGKGLKTLIDEAEEQIILLENLRFHPSEEKNDPGFAAELASLGDAFVNDAFSVAHRAHASTDGITKFLPSVAGKLLAKELDALEKALGNPEKPLVALVGGAKVSSKLNVLTNLVTKVDHLIIGGGMANTFLAAQGVNVGASLCEHDLKETALNILAVAEKSECEIHLPIDVRVAKEFKNNAKNTTCWVRSVLDDDMILDIGPLSTNSLCVILNDCKTLIWNGPMGAFEIKPFDEGTSALAKAAAKLTQNGKLKTVAGGGDTIAALANAGVVDMFSHISTAGGAFLEWMEGKDLPGVKVLEQGP